jgi:hypothetical protein
MSPNSLDFIFSSQTAVVITRYLIVHWQGQEAGYMYLIISRPQDVLQPHPPSKQRAFSPTSRPLRSLNLQATLEINSTTKRKWKFRKAAGNSQAYDYSQSTLLAFSICSQPERPEKSRHQNRYSSKAVQASIRAIQSTMTSTTRCSFFPAHYTNDRDSATSRPNASRIRSACPFTSRFLMVSFSSSFKST